MNHKSRICICVREIPHQQEVSVRDFRVEQRVITKNIYIYIYILILASQNDPKPHTRILNENAEYDNERTENTS